MAGRGDRDSRSGRAATGFGMDARLKKRAQRLLKRLWNVSFM
jgi:hypothetical protein